MVLFPLNSGTFFFFFFKWSINTCQYPLAIVWLTMGKLSSEESGGQRVPCGEDETHA